ncbi:MAG TPA: hypothetical protein DCP08_09325 [Chloroflexi bacterium]|nr:hypothetical protein [Chloroflexota bacterium]
MIITTTLAIEGRPIGEYLGVVTDEAILGAHIGRDIALEEMASAATSKGGNAVVGVDIDYQIIRDGMLMVSASGTAVKVR